MSVFELNPVSLPSGDFAAAWFDDEQRLWDDERLHKAQPLLAVWSAPKLRLHRPESGPTPVLFNPNAYAVSEGVRSALSALSGIEFLPIEVANLGTFFVLHVVASCPVPPACSIRRSSVPGGNIVELFAFPIGYSAKSDLFRVLQPEDSAAGRAGYCLTAIYANDFAAGVIERACGKYLAARELVHA